MEGFDYDKTVAAIESIVLKVEDPATGFDEAGRLIDRAMADLERCYEYLRKKRDE